MDVQRVHVNSGCIADWGEQREVVECCESGRLLATVKSTCSSRDLLASRDLLSDDRRRQTGDAVDRSCAVVHNVCCLAERRHARCRRGVSQALAATPARQQQQQQQQDRVDDDECQHLSDDAKVLHAVNSVGVYQLIPDITKDAVCCHRLQCYNKFVNFQIERLLTHQKSFTEKIL